MMYLGLVEQVHFLNWSLRSSTFCSSFLSLPPSLFYLLFPLSLCFTSPFTCVFPTTLFNKYHHYQHYLTTESESKLLNKSTPLWHYQHTTTTTTPPRPTFFAYCHQTVGMSRARPASSGGLMCMKMGNLSLSNVQQELRSNSLALFHTPSLVLGC